MSPANSNTLGRRRMSSEAQLSAILSALYPSVSLPCWLYVRAASTHSAARR